MFLHESFLIAMQSTWAHRDGAIRCPAKDWDWKASCSGFITEIFPACRWTIFIVNILFFVNGLSISDALVVCIILSQSSFLVDSNRQHCQQGYQQWNILRICYLQMMKMSIIAKDSRLNTIFSRESAYTCGPGCPEAGIIPIVDFGDLQWIDFASSARLDAGYVTVLFCSRSIRDGHLKSRNRTVIWSRESIKVVATV